MASDPLHADELARRLKAKRTNTGWVARCPAHDDRHSSLSIGEGENGRLLLKCHAGCTFDQIMDAAGVEKVKPNGGDHGRQRRTSTRLGGGQEQHITATYDYRDLEHHLIYQVIRLEPKSFRQRRPNGSGGWIYNMNGVERIPYRLDEWYPEQGTVFVVEGEKDADALYKLGLFATCNPGGAGKWPDSFAQFFADRDVLIIPDNDEAGRKHAGLVGTQLLPVAASIRLLELPDLPEKGDVSDWLKTRPLEALEDLAARAQPIDQQILDRLCLGRPPLLPFSYIAHHDLAADIPRREFLVAEWVPCGCITSLYGVGGSGKSFLAMIMAMCVASGRSFLGQFECRKAVILGIMCEDDEDELKRRRNKIARSLGIHQSEIEGTLFLTPRVGEINALMEFPNGVAARTELFERIIADAKRLMARLIILDNAAQLFGGNENDRAQVTAFLNACAGIARSCNGAVLLLGHPPKLPGAEFSGSTAWDAVVRSRIWFKRLEDDEHHQPSPGPIRYSMELVKSNYAKRFGIELLENSHGVVEYAREFTKLERPRLDSAERTLNVLRELFAIHRRAIHIDELIPECIRVGIVADAEIATSGWRDRKRTLRKHLAANAKFVEEREADNFAIKP